MIVQAYVNPSTLGRWMVSLPSPAEHERLVASFLSSAETDDPTRYAAIAESTPILSRTREEAIRLREISAFSPSLEANGGAGLNEYDAVGGSGYGMSASESSLDDYISLQATVDAALDAAPLRP